MKSTIRDLDDVRIIELSGKITIGSGDVKLRELIQQALDTGHSKIVLDLAGVTAIDSSGIGEMVGRAAQAAPAVVQDQRHPPGHPADHGLRRLRHRAGGARHAAELIRRARRRCGSAAAGTQVR